MNRKEFLQKLTNTYPISFYDFIQRDGQKIRIPKEGDPLGKYKEVLPENDTQYGKLYRKMLEEHSKSFAPEPALLLAMLKDLQPKEFYKPPKYAPQPIPEECKRVIEALRAKYRKRINEKLWH